MFLECTIVNIGFGLSQLHRFMNITDNVEESTSILEIANSLYTVPQRYNTGWGKVPKIPN